MMTYRSLVVYLIALALGVGSGYLAIRVDDGFTSFVILAVMIFILMMYLVFAKASKAASNFLFALLFFAIGFWVFWFGGFALAFLFESNCHLNDDGETRCVMPTIQLLLGFIVALIVTPLSWKFYKQHRTQKIDILWQVAVATGWAVGMTLQWLGVCV